MEARKFPLICPQPECKKGLVQSDLNDLLDDDEFEKFMNLSLQSFIDSNAQDVTTLGRTVIFTFPRCPGVRRLTVNTLL